MKRQASSSRLTPTEGGGAAVLMSPPPLAALPQHAREPSSGASEDPLGHSVQSGRSSSTHHTTRTTTTSHVGAGLAANSSPPSQSQLQQQQQQLLFDPSGAASSRRALLYDVERHKLEALPLTRLFRFLADRPHWLTDSGSQASNRDAQSEANVSRQGPSSPAAGGGAVGSRMKAVVRSLVVAQPEGGRHVSKRQRDIDRARLASVLADGHDDLIIPDTIVWEASIPRGWFFTSLDGSDGRATVQRRNVDIGAIEKQWTEGLAPHAVAACFYTIAERDPAASVADKDTPLLQYQFLRACELSRFLHVQATQTSANDCAAILQQFAAPLHAHNVVIQAVWSPRVLNITIRQNVNALHDDRLDANSRACTFEGSPHLSLELRPTTRLYGQVEAAVHSLTKHFAAVDLKNRIVRLVAYFKVDKQSQLNLLFVPSIRVLRTALIERPIGVRSSPFFSAFRVALDVAVEYEPLLLATAASEGGGAGGGGGGSGSAGASSGGGAGGASSLPAHGTAPHSQEPARIRKSKADPQRGGGAGGHLFEGSRLLADALHLSLRELNIEQSSAERQQRNNSAHGSGGLSRQRSMRGAADGGMMSSPSIAFSSSSMMSEAERREQRRAAEQEERHRQTLQYQLDHSPVIENQRVELIEVVIDIIEASPSVREAAHAVTRAYRHAATPAARDALRWAAGEAGMVCIDDGYGHLTFEPGKELLAEERDALIAAGNDPDEVASATGVNKTNSSIDESGGAGGSLSNSARGSARGARGASPFNPFLAMSGGGGASMLLSPAQQSHDIVSLLADAEDPLAMSKLLDGHDVSALLSPSPSLSRAAASLRASVKTVVGSSFMRRAGAAHVPCWKDIWGVIKSSANDFVYELSTASESGLGLVITGANSGSSHAAVSARFPPCVADFPGVSAQAAAVCSTILATCAHNARQRAAAARAASKGSVASGIFEQQQHLQQRFDGAAVDPACIAPVVAGLWPDVRVRDAVAIVLAGAVGLLHTPDDVAASMRELQRQSTATFKHAGSASPSSTDDEPAAVRVETSGRVVATAQPGMSMLRVEVRNASQTNIQCLMRKAVGDVLLAIKNNHITLLLPEKERENGRRATSPSALSPSGGATAPTSVAAAAVSALALGGTALLPAAVRPRGGSRAAGNALSSPPLSPPASGSPKLMSPIAAALSHGSGSGGIESNGPPSVLVSQGSMSAGAAMKGDSDFDDDDDD